MTLNFIQIILVPIVSFLCWYGRYFDEFHFHQPVIACTLIGLGPAIWPHVWYRGPITNDRFRANIGGRPLHQMPHWPQLRQLLF